MAPHPRLTPRRRDSLDVPLRQLTIRTLGARDGAPAPDAVERVRGEFVEMRGFSPTLEQAARLFHMPEQECSEILTLLTRQGFIREMADGRYRLIDGQ